MLEVSIEIEIHRFAN